MDNTQVFHEQIEPLMDQVLEIAQQHKMPFAATFQTNQTDEGFGFVGVQNLNKETTQGDISSELHVVALARNAPGTAVKFAAMLLLQAQK